MIELFNALRHEYFYQLWLADEGLIDSPFWRSDYLLGR